MSAADDLTPDELTEIKRFTGVHDDREAIANAAREFLRVSRLRELKLVSGKFDYECAGDAMEALEVREIRPNATK